MKKVLVIASHPDLHNSYVNKLILDKLHSCNRLNIEIRHIESIYTGYTIDVKLEQEKLLVADIIVMQFPFYWYSVPSPLKNWIDKVFTYGFAYGTAGDKLKGKQLIASFSIGGPEESITKMGIIISL